MNKYPDQKKTAPKGVLVLNKGPHYEGYFFGKKTNGFGEVVFNTGMVGYPETFTDPSYRGQILVLTYPLVGNYGVPDDTIEDGLKKYFESNAIHIRGLVVSDYSFEHSHWNAVKSLDMWLKEYEIPGLYGIDTRALTKHLRTQGVCPGMITTPEDVDEKIPNEESTHPVAEVSTKKRIEYVRGKKKVLLIDCGVKNSIITSLLKRNITVIQVPWDHDISKETYDGILVSNGPGDPKTCTETINTLRTAMKGSKPIFGICLGNQLLALASGAETYKLPFGHRGQNQPCIDVKTDRCYITSQNHGYAVDEKTLGKDWEVWFQNANDGTNEGIKHTTKPFFSVQFHPEACPGPSDTDFLFDLFIKTLTP